MVLILIKKKNIFAGESAAAIMSTDIGCDNEHKEYEHNFNYKSCKL